MSEQLYHFECGECGIDDKEIGALAKENQVYCGSCAGDTGRDVRLKRWKARPDEGAER